MRYGADVKTTAKNRNITPLHKAKSRSIVQLLCENEADPNAVMSNSNGKEVTVFDALLQKNHKAASGLLDYFIGTNGEELDSPDLQIIFDFQFMVDESKVQLNVADETVVANKIIQSGKSFLLDHPLVSSTLHCSTTFISQLYFWWILIYGMTYLIPVNALYLMTPKFRFNGTESLQEINWPGEEGNIKYILGNGVSLIFF